MKMHVKFLLSGLALLIMACGTGRPETEKTDPVNRLTQLDSIGQAFIDQGKVLGISVAIMQGKDTVYTQGFGFADMAKTKPVTPQTKFKLASVSKLIGSTLVMRLTEEGKLSLDQTLYELMPDFPNQEQAEKITLRHMLSHTSGLQDYATEIDSAYVRTGIAPSKDDYYAFFRDRELLFEPGTDYSYSNSGFWLMGQIVEKITGHTLQQEFDRVINASTGINLTLAAQAVNDPDLSQYVELRDSVFRPFPIWTWIKGDGGLTGTAIELAHFPKQWAEGGIISSASFQEMTEPMVLSNGIQTGYGIGVRNGTFLGEKIIGHTGGHHSTYAMMVYFPERDLTIITFINTDHTPTSVKKIFAEFARTILGKETPAYKDQKTSSDRLSNYVGTYRAYDEKIEQKTSIELSPDGQYLSYCMDGECVRMFHLGNHTFWVEKWPYDLIVFHVNPKGEVLAIKEYYTGYYAVLRKRITP